MLVQTKKHIPTGESLLIFLILYLNYLSSYNNKLIPLSQEIEPNHPSTVLFNPVTPK